LRTHLQRLAKNTGEVDPRLNIAWPKLGRPLWEAFQRLDRQPSMGGLGPITLQGIQAYESLYRVRFTEWELDVLHIFDRIAMELSNKTQT
jgi:hypothetical protein